MFMDEKGKLFGKVSIIDVLVVVVILAGIVGAVFAFGKINSGAVLTENKGIVRHDSTLDTLEVTMRLREVRSMTKDAIHIGDEVFAKDTGKYLGTVVSVTSEPAKKIISGFDGRSALATVPEKMDVLMVLHVGGKRTDGGFFTGNNIHLVYGSEMQIITPSIQSTPMIEQIKIVTEE